MGLVGVGTGVRVVGVGAGVRACVGLAHGLLVATGFGGQAFLMAWCDFGTSSPLFVNHSSWLKVMKGWWQSMHRRAPSRDSARRLQTVQRP